MYACLGGQAPPTADDRLERDTLQAAGKRWRGHYSPNFLGLIDACLRLDRQQRPRDARGMQQILLDGAAFNSGGASLLGKLRRLFAA
jgi:hypothetical protein